MSTRHRDLERLSALNDPVRRALYFFVAARSGEVSRDQAARGVRVARALAAFHLDKLVRHGLLETSYRRLGKRRGPGAGRPAKLYRRSGLQLQVSLPAREYELAARLFADVIAAAPRSIGARVGATARSFGTSIGREARQRTGQRTGRKGSPQRIEDVLGELGYEPFHAPDGQIRLRNCPFDTLAREHRALVCDANLHLMRGLVAGFGLAGISPRQELRPGQCCVAFRLVRK
jgi:predicted ArsR family transcriptional regulator